MSSSLNESRLAPSRLPKRTRERRADLPVPAAFVDECRLALQMVGVPNISSVGITSSVRGEGRTIVSIASALVFADYGVPTVLLDLDLERPHLANRLGIPDSPGLGELLDGEATLAEVLLPVANDLFLLPTGRLSTSAPRAMTEIASSDLLRNIQRQGRAIVADLPPLLGSSIGRPAAGLFTDLLL
ncbi:MAG: hypothetical protein ACRENM_09285, partial [Candidatus Dormibacteraceae bacterium]